MITSEMTRSGKGLPTDSSASRPLVAWQTPNPADSRMKVRCRRWVVLSSTTSIFFKGPLLFDAFDEGARYFSQRQDQVGATCLDGRLGHPENHRTGLVL